MILMDLGSLSREELEALAQEVSNRLESMTKVWEVEQRRAWAVRELGRMAGNRGPIPASPVPGDGFMPGQVVEADGTLFVNRSGAWVDYAPGDEPVSAWEEIEETPGPDPDPEPDPNEPEYEEWSQPSAGSEYELGAKVTHNGRLWENTYDRNGWEPGTPHSQWTDLGPVEDQ